MVEPMPMPESWYTPARVRVLLRLLPYYVERAPRLRWSEPLVHGGRRYSNSDEWWWDVRGDLLAAVDRLGYTERIIVEICTIGGQPYRAVAARLGMSPSSVWRAERRAVEEIAYRLGWEPDAEECSRSGGQ